VVQLLYAISMAVIYVCATTKAQEKSMVRDGATVKLIGIFSLQVSDFSYKKNVSTHIQTYAGCVEARFGGRRKGCSYRRRRCG